MKLTTLLSACAIGFFLTGCTAETEMSTDAGAATEHAADGHDDHDDADGHDDDHDGGGDGHADHDH